MAVSSATVAGWLQCDYSAGGVYANSGYSVATAQAVSTLTVVTVWLQRRR